MASASKREQEAQEAELYEQIGRLKMELEWLKKKLPASIRERRPMIDIEEPVVRVRRQRELLGLKRSSFYYQATPEPALNLHLMRLFAKRSVCRHRQAIPAHALLWLAQDDRPSTAAELRHQWQTSQTADASDGHSSYLPQEKQQFSWQGAQALSLSLAQRADYACQPGLER